MGVFTYVCMCICAIQGVCVCVCVAVEVYVNKCTHLCMCLLFVYLPWDKVMFCNPDWTQTILSSQPPKNQFTRVHYCIQLAYILV